MKIENLDRAVKLGAEIKNVSLQLAHAKQLQSEKSGFIITSNSDMSGTFVNYVYENGNYASDMYANIIDSVVCELSAHLDKLNREVSEL